MHVLLIKRTDNSGYFISTDTSGFGQQHPITLGYKQGIYVCCPFPEPDYNECAYFGITQGFEWDDTRAGNFLWDLHPTGDAVNLPQAVKSPNKCLVQLRISSGTHFEIKSVLRQSTLLSLHLQRPAIALGRGPVPFLSLDTEAL